jgi:hypothetical protein
MTMGSSEVHTVLIQYNEYEGTSEMSNKVQNPLSPRSVEHQSILPSHCNLKPCNTLYFVMLLFYCKNYTSDDLINCVQIKW